MVHECMKNKIVECIHTKIQDNPSNMLRLVLGPNFVSPPIGHQEKIEGFRLDLVGCEVGSSFSMTSNDSLLLEKIYFDMKQNLPGESVYIVNSKNVLDNVINDKVLQNLFGDNIVLDNLALEIERQYLESVLHMLSLAKKSGNILVGKRQIKEYLGSSSKNSNKFLLLQASDASEAERFVEDDIIKIFDIFSRNIISKACGKENLVYILVQGRFAILIEDIISRYQTYMNN